MRAGQRAQVGFLLFEKRLVPLVRRALLTTAIGSLDRLPALPVVEAVKTRFCRLFQCLGELPGRYFRPDVDYQARALCACVLLKRFPAAGWLARWRCSRL